MTKCDYILENVSMAELMDYYGIKVEGNKCLCKFHDDHNPSACVKGRWFKCFACNTCVNVIDFVAKYEHCSRKVAIAKINEMFKLGLDGKLTEEQKAEITKAQEERELKKKLEARRKAYENQALDKIVKELRFWEQVEKIAHPTRGQIRNDTWKLDWIFFHSLKQQDYLDWLYDRVCGFTHPECEYDYFDFANDKKYVIAEKIVKCEIPLEVY